MCIYGGLYAIRVAYAWKTLPREIIGRINIVEVISASLASRTKDVATSSLSFARGEGEENQLTDNGSRVGKNQRTERGFAIMRNDMLCCMDG